MAKQLWSKEGKILVSNDKKRALNCEDCPCDEPTPECSAYFSWEADPDDCLEITFTDETIVSGGVISSWFWTFDDGSFSGDQNPTHTYDDPGTYNVQLVVTLESGEACEVTLPVEVCAGFEVNVCGGAPILLPNAWEVTLDGYTDQFQQGFHNRPCADLNGVYELPFTWDETLGVPGNRLYRAYYQLCFSPIGYAAPTNDEDAEPFAYLDFLMIQAAVAENFVTSGNCFADVRLTSIRLGGDPRFPPVTPCADRMPFAPYAGGGSYFPSASGIIPVGSYPGPVPGSTPVLDIDQWLVGFSSINQYIHGADGGANQWRGPDANSTNDCFPIADTSNPPQGGYRAHVRAL